MGQDATMYGTTYMYNVLSSRNERKDKVQKNDFAF